MLIKDRSTLMKLLSFRIAKKLHKENSYNYFNDTNLVFNDILKECLFANKIFDILSKAVYFAFH